MIVDSTDGFAWANTVNFELREYKAMINKEDGSEVEEDVNEASNLIQLMIGGIKGGQIRLNGGKNHRYSAISKMTKQETVSYMVKSTRVVV